MTHNGINGFILATLQDAGRRMQDVGDIKQVMLGIRIGIGFPGYGPDSYFSCILHPASCILHD
jgi:hypothetical protein